MPRFNTKMFSWNVKDRSFATEASTLGNADIRNGFELVSQRTGAVVKCKPTRTVFCGTEDNEVVAWEFTGPNFSVTVFND